MKPLFCFLLIFGACQSPIAQNINASGTTVQDRFLLPKGFIRKPVERNSFAEFLRQFSLKNANSKVYLFNGKEKNNAQHMAVLDIDRGTKDLQQCADAVMRLRSEYLYKQHNFDKISFKNFKNEAMTYPKYQAGYRMTNNGYIKVKAQNASKEGFRNYLDMVFSYANTYTLEKELKKINLENIQIGDIFIVSNLTSYGHAMIVMDVAENSQTKEKIFLLAQSYMPAQDIHIVKNPGGGAWYKLSDISTVLVTPEWTFPANSLHRF